MRVKASWLRRRPLPVDDPRQPAEVREVLDRMPGLLVELAEATAELRAVHGEGVAPSEERVIDAYRAVSAVRRQIRETVDESADLAGVATLEEILDWARQCRQVYGSWHWL